MINSTRMMRTNVSIPARVLTKYDDLPVLPQDFPLVGFLEHFNEPIGSRGLEIGANENYCSAILQRNGYEMTGLDANPYRPERLLLDRSDSAFQIFWKQITSTVKNARSMVQHPYDFIVSLSAIEHFGLGYYGDEVNPTADLEAMTDAYCWLKPGGRFYLTVPTGSYKVTNHWRRYDTEHLANLVGKFKIAKIYVLFSHDLPNLQAEGLDIHSLQAAMTWDGIGCNYEPLFILEKR
jgi:hypothetical protein